MARKSRKIAAAEPVCEAAPLQIFPTAIYARLSVENSGKSEKVDVITNQIEICKSYIAGCPYLDLVDVYVDNGRTGTVFDRPEFNRLMTDIKSGRIKCLVVRDLSRFGRDYIETGTYLERGVIGGQSIINFTVTCGNRNIGTVKMFLQRQSDRIGNIGIPVF